MADRKDPLAAEIPEFKAPTRMDGLFWGVRRFLFLVFFYLAPPILVFSGLVAPFIDDEEASVKVVITALALIACAVGLRLVAADFAFGKPYKLALLGSFVELWVAAIAVVLILTTPAWCIGVAAIVCELIYMFIHWWRMGTFPWKMLFPTV